MQYRTLGQSDLEVSALAMGCWAITGDALWGPQEESDAIEAVEASLEAGINFFDTAEGYGSGRSEALLARALGTWRDQALIATKVSDSHLEPDDVRAACERSLKNLRTDRIDLYQIHWPNPDVPLADTMGALQELQAQGKVRAIGVSNFGPRDLGDFLALARPQSNQVMYNLLTRAIEYEVQPACVEHGIGILCYSPLAQGLLTGKFAGPEDVPDGRARSRHFSSARKMTRHGEPGCEQETFEAIAAVRQVARRVGVSMSDLALAWCLARPGITAVIAGARSAQQARTNARAADIRLDPDVVKELNAATDEVKKTLGPSPDLWQASDKSRMR